ncbi:unnamed protein product [Angiostrongylus costaricensis]|uniref:Uncharacterized protein n=1 Tax=Angiostrongylus costaricensis TaxID=334426 RepID=A0A158PDQ9_ANGCS|nr:unnamed protein product [Angiostrongylus costaricensis]
MYQWHLLVSLAVITVIEAHREKRQLSIDDLISKALSLVRPIFDTSQPLQYDEMFKKQPIPSTDDLRDSIILGSRSANPFDNIPLCKGSNRICQFISCSAENFKKDPTFGNIQLAAQVLSDRKLRQTITIDSICKEQGMSDEPQQLEIRNDLVASLTPLPPAPFIHPTPPSAPPLAFPTVPSIIMPPISFPTSAIEKLFQKKVGDISNYFGGFSSPDSSPSSSTPIVSEDYYGSVDESTPKRQELRSPLKNCVHILGIY